ncbi:Ulp1 protease family protein, partial [Colletotrichum truncatum]
SPLTQLHIRSRFLAFRSSHRHNHHQPQPNHHRNSSSSTSSSTSVGSSLDSSAPSSPPTNSPTNISKSGPRSESRLSMPFRKMARHFGDTVRPFSSHLSSLHSSFPPHEASVALLSHVGRQQYHQRRRTDGWAHAPFVSSPRLLESSCDAQPNAAGYHRGGMLSPQAPYLSYHDILLTYEDIKSLKNDWLTDNNIAFWEEWLEREILPKYPQARIVLLRPSMTFLLMKEPDMRQIRSALPDFRKVTHIFLPINDARNVAQAEGGSHWSLLLVSAIDGVAFHYDSLGGANFAEGRLATHKMSEILGRPLRYLNLDDAPQQENGSDCGVFVCILMRHLLVKRLLSANAREKVSMSMANKLIDSHGGRKEMLKIIESLRKEGERRRS